MSAYFVCLDTSILVPVAEALAAGIKLTGWSEFQKLIQDGEAKLLVPEIVLLELEGRVRDNETELLKQTTEIEKAIKTPGLKKTLKDWRKQSQKNFEEEIAKIVEWLRTGALIEFTEAIAHQTKKRLIASRYMKPPKGNDPANAKAEQWLRDQDCFIIDSLVTHLNGKVKDKFLLFGTTDGGFGKVETNTKTGPLDQRFQDGLPTAKIFSEFGPLVRFVMEKKPIIPPTKDELEAEQKQQIEERIEQELKLQQEVAYRIVKPVSAIFSFPIETGPPGDWLDGMESQQRANDSATRRRMEDDRRRQNENYDRPQTIHPPVEPREKSDEALPPESP